MRDALRSGDPEAYFRLLAESELLIPVTSGTVDDVLANHAQPTWPTADADGRTHVLAYTSPEAMRASGPARFQHFMKLTFADIAGAWPDTRWWLTVDAGLPIQAQLPSWFVRQIADGDTRPPSAGLPARVRAAAPPVIPPLEPPEPAFVPSGELERELLAAGERGDNDAYITTLLGAQVLIPVPGDTDPDLHPGRPGFPWLPNGQVLTVFTSPERLLEATGGTEFLRFPFAAVIRSWPDVSWTLSVNPGSPVGAMLRGEELPGLAEWADQRAALRLAENFAPQNDLEERLFDAAARRDLDVFFKVLLAGQVLVAADPGTPWGTRPEDTDFPWRPVPVRARPSIVAFTSLKWLHGAIGATRFLIVDVLDLVTAWPDPAWTLVLNPGTPVDATVPGDQVRALAGPPDPVPVPAPPPVPPPVADAVVPPGFEPGNRIDQELFEAAESGDTDSFLRVLFAANVLVPIPPDAPLEVPPTEPDFQWEAALREPSSVQVFTSLVRLREALPEDGSARFVYCDFRDLIQSWPKAEWSMLLNPGTRIGASLDGDQVGALSEWAVRTGLIDTAEPAMVAPMPFHAPVPPWPPAEPEPKLPTLMQKVLPPDHVAWYLEQGYDRIGGFVNPMADTAGLLTPGQLYEALGLLYEGSPFTLEDEGVHVVSWPAYCEDLYRIPFGGQAEEELAGWGDAGWVIERAPFQGTGFAPGSAGTIRELKVDSARLPYGAEMFYVGRDRSRRLVAAYDPDLLVWVRPEETQ